jgi:outer membrane biosynthesis protein TonB
MANITKQLTSVSLDSRSGSPPGRRLLALTLVVMLVLGSTFPSFALAGEADSEGEGTAPPVEVPVDPGLDPGGEEEALEETPAAGGDEETGAVEAEAEVDLEAPPADEVTSAATQAPEETAASAPTASPEPATASEPEPEPVQQKAPEAKTSEPVAGQSIVGPKPKRAERQAAASGGSTTGEAAPAGESPPEEAPAAPAPQPAAPPPADHGRHLAGKDSYVVKSGDCLWHIAEALLPPDAGTSAIAAEVERLWRLNGERIGTGDPSLIHTGTTLRLR